MSKDTTQKSIMEYIRCKKLQVGVFSSILLAAMSIFIIYQITKTEVILNMNGEQKEVSTHAETVKELLEEQNITVSKYDKVTPNLNEKIQENMEIIWKQAREVTISIDGKNSTLWTTETKVENILKEANIRLSESDVVSPNLSEPIDEQGNITINKAFPITLVDGNKKKQVWSTSTTVANFLKQQGIQLNELDRVETKLEQVLKPKDQVKIVRVEKVTDVVEESIDYPVQLKKDSTLLKGSQKVLVKGEKGLVSKTYEVIKENGKVVSKTLKSKKVIKEPTTQVVAKGTKIVTANVSRGSAPNSKVFYVTATAYTPYCNGCTGKSATGLNLKNPKLKVIAVDPKVIPLGSKVWVEGYGYAIAADTGGAIKGKRIDVLFHSKKQVYNWGVKRVKIKILN